MSTDKIKLPISWSIKTSPECIRKMLQDERINSLIETRNFRCRIGSLTGGWKDDLAKTVILPMEPHGVISNIYVDNGKWYADVLIPDVGTNWNEMVDIMREPVLYPFMVGNVATGEYQLIHFGIIEKSGLDPNHVYDGIHHDTSEDVAVTSPMKLFRILISDNQDHYVHFGISIIVKAENINHAYMKFWENIINDKHIDFSDGEADPLFENDHFSNWVIDTYDDKYITYERPGKNFKIRVEELDLSKGYALVGDWST